MGSRKFVPSHTWEEGGLTFLHTQAGGGAAASRTCNAVTQAAARLSSAPRGAATASSSLLQLFPRHRVSSSQVYICHGDEIIPKFKSGSFY